VNVPRRNCSNALLWIILPGLFLPVLARGQAADTPPVKKAAPKAPTTPARKALKALKATPPPAAAPDETATAAPATSSAAATSRTAVPAAPPKAGQAQTAEEQNDLKVRTLEERVSDLKEKVFRTKARLMNLQEMVIGGDITTGAKAVIIHRNEMGSSFYLESVTYALDGAPVYTKADLDGDLDKREEFEVFNGRIVPGNHQLAVQMVFRGYGFGFFSYLKDYKFKAQSAYTINAEPGKVITVKVVGYEKGGMTSELKDRPNIKYEQEVQKEEPGPRKSGPAMEGAKK
jgi:hypothetical protein